MQTSQALKKEGEKGKGGGQNENFKSVRNKTVMRDKELHVGQVEGWVRRRRKLNQKREQEAEAKADGPPRVR